MRHIVDAGGVEGPTDTSQLDRVLTQAAAPAADFASVQATAAPAHPLLQDHVQFGQHHVIGREVKALDPRLITIGSKSS